jgi:hypothetical protein
MIGETILAIPAKAIGTIRHAFRPDWQAKQRGIMDTGSSKSLDRRASRKSYTAVLFEIDKTKIPERIAQAETALALRARESFYAARDNIEEGQALDDAV